MSIIRPKYLLREVHEVRPPAMRCESVEKPAMSEFSIVTLAPSHPGGKRCPEPRRSSHVIGDLLVDVALEQVAQELRPLVLASVCRWRWARQVLRWACRKLFVLLFEDGGPERVVDVHGADHLALGHKRHGDDRAQVSGRMTELLALEPIVEAGVGPTRTACPALHDNDR